MCDLMTIGVPSEAGEQTLDPALDERGAAVFSFDPWTNEGGGHAYCDGFTVFSIRFEDQDCSCGVLGSGDAQDLMDLRLLEYLGGLARRLGEIQFLIHWHGQAFASEPFPIESTVELSPSELVPLAKFARDTRYIVRT